MRDCKSGVKMTHENYSHYETNQFMRVENLAIGFDNSQNHFKSTEVPTMR